MVSLSDIRRIAGRIGTEYGPEKIILFGSYAWGRPSAASDVDFLIVKETKKPFHKRWAEVCGIVADQRRGIAFSPFVVTPGELDERIRKRDPFIARIIKEGKVLYE